MNNRYIKPAGGFTLGGLLGWITIQFLTTSDKDWEVNYPTYIVAILAFAMLGGFVGALCNGIPDENSPEEVLKRNNKTLAKLEKVFKDAQVSLLTQLEFTNYSAIIQNKPPFEIAEINIKIANYQAAIDAIYPLNQEIPVKQILVPITLTNKHAPSTAYTYEYEVLKNWIEENKHAVLIDPTTELAINQQNFSFSKNYVPEIMDFIKEVRAVIQQHNRASAAPLPLIYGQDPGFLTFNRSRRISQYAQLAYDSDLGNMTSISVAELRF